ncbi:MAG: hypothetical protein SGILL_000825 [Bacillariaceae sp.]
MVLNSRSFYEEDPDTSSSSNHAQNDVTYLNNAGKAILDPQVVKVGRTMVGQAPYASSSPGDMQDQIRSSFAQLIHADQDDIAIMPSTAFAITLAAKNIQRLHGQTLQHPQQNRTKILLLQDQMNSAVYPWQQICDESSNDETPMSLHIVPYPKTHSQGWTEAVLSELSEHGNEILVACLPPLHWSDGSLVDLNAIAAACHAKDILLVVDATQAVGIMSIDVHKMRPAMLACSVHKWLRGPSGASLVYIDSNLHDKWEPLDQHGRSRDLKYGSDWEAYPNQMTARGYPEQFCLGARKFDAGGKPNSILLPMLQKSLEQVVKRVDLDKAQEEMREIVAPFLTWIANNQDKFMLPPGDHAFHLMGIRPTNQWLTVEQMLEIERTLANEQRVYLAVRCGAFRVAPYLDTTQHQMTRFIETFEKILQSYYR